jgi:hypothetical protein
MAVNALWMQKKYDLFIWGLLKGGLSRTPTSTVSCGPNVDESSL